MKPRLSKQVSTKLQIWKNERQYIKFENTTTIVVNISWFAVGGIIVKGALKTLNRSNEKLKFLSPLLHLRWAMTWAYVVTCLEKFVCFLSLTQSSNFFENFFLENVKFFWNIEKTFIYLQTCNFIHFHITTYKNLLKHLHNFCVWKPAILNSFSHDHTT